MVLYLTFYSPPISPLFNLISPFPPSQHPPYSLPILKGLSPSLIAFLPRPPVKVPSSKLILTNISKSKSVAPGNPTLQQKKVHPNSQHLQPHWVQFFPSKFIRTVRVPVSNISPRFSTHHTFYPSSFTFCYLQPHVGTSSVFSSPLFQPCCFLFYRSWSYTILIFLLLYMFPNLLLSLYTILTSLFLNVFFVGFHMGFDFCNLFHPNLSLIILPIYRVSTTPMLWLSSVTLPITILVLF